MEMNREIYLTFIHLENTFDMVDWEILFKTMKNAGIDWRDRRLILKLYQNQITKININGAEVEAKVRKGVRQGCPLSPYLFNLYIEGSINIMKQKTKGLTINGTRIHSGLPMKLS
jgi:hypothetical protein